VIAIIHKNHHSVFVEALILADELLHLYHIVVATVEFPCEVESENQCKHVHSKTGLKDVIPCSWPT
jgi:hypothetical protein